jgi:inner membrane protein YidH
MYMADPRDLLAAERTLLAWIRTGIALMGLGFVVCRFGLFMRELALVGNHAATQHFDSALIGTLLMAAGVVVNVWASLRHRSLVRRLREGVTEISSAGPVAIGLATGIAGVVLMAILIGAAAR